MKSNGETNHAAPDKSHLRPKFSVGDYVYASCWPTDEAGIRGVSGDASSTWEPGIVLGTSKSYHVLFDDGQERYDVGAGEMYHRDDYLLWESRRGDWLGVQNVTAGRGSSDKWSEFIGWYVASIDGKKCEFSRLTDAIDAYDMSVVRRDGDGTEPADLNLADKLPLYLQRCKAESSNGVVHPRQEPTLDLNAIQLAIEGVSQQQSNAHHVGKRGMTVYIQLLDDELGEVEALESETIRAFKMRIEKSYERELISNKLVFNGQELNNDETISHYGLADGDIVVAQMQIYVGFLSKKGYLLDVSPNDTIGVIKTMVESKEPDFRVSRQRLFLDGVCLNNDLTLKKSQVYDGANLLAISRGAARKPKPGMMQIYVKCDDRVKTVNVRSGNTIQSLKTMLHETEGIVPSNQRLSFRGLDLEDDSYSLLDCGVESESLLYLVGPKDSVRVDSRWNHEEIDVPQEVVHEPTEQEEGDDRAKRTGQDTSTIRIEIINQSQPDQAAVRMNVEPTKPLHRLFSEYASKLNVSLEGTQFSYDGMELPGDCEFTAEILGISDGSAIMARHSTATEPPTQEMPEREARQFIQNMLEERFEQPADLTVYSEGFRVEDVIVLNLQGIGRELKVKVVRHITTLQLVFSSFADVVGVDAASLLFIYNTRRLSYASEETAEQINLGEGDTIHAIATISSSETSSCPAEGRVLFHILELGKPETDKMIFNAAVDKGMARYLDAFAKRQSLNLDRIRFIYQERVIYASGGDVTPLQLDLCESSTVYAVIKKEAPLPITPNAIKTLHTMPQGRIFEPVLQVARCDELGLQVSDGAESLSLSYHARLQGVIKKYAIICASDISIETDNTGRKFTLVDAYEASPNPGKMLLSSEITGSDNADDRMDRAADETSTDQEAMASEEEKKSADGERTVEASEELPAKPAASDKGVSLGENTSTEPRIFPEDWTERRHLHKMPRGDGAKLHRKWLQRSDQQGSSAGEKFHCPQVGDSVVYVFGTHEKVLNKFSSVGIPRPWESWPTLWPAVRCRVKQGIRYRFPYQECYSQGRAEKYPSIPAILTLVVTGVPAESSGHHLLWRTASFVPPSPSRSIEFDVTLFQCNEEEFLLPDSLYQWRMNELEKAIETNNGVEGLGVVARWPPNSDDRSDADADADADNQKYVGELLYIDRRDDRRSGDRIVMVSDDGAFAACCPWNITMQNPSSPPPTVPSIDNKTRNKLMNALKKVIRLDPRIGKLFSDVDLRKHPDYLDMVELPMHLSLIQKRLKNKYYTNKQSVVSDMETIRQNVYKYHDDDKELKALASMMYEKFKSLVDSVIE